MPSAAQRSPQPAPQTLTDWLRGRSDPELVALLRRRPDLALPAPVDLATLASRASVRTSISRALDALDAFTLRTLEVLTCLPAPVALTDLQGWFAPADRAAVELAGYRLREWTLIWGADRSLHPVGTVREVLGPYPAGLGRTAAQLFGSVNDLVLAPLLRRLELAPASQPRSGSSAAGAVTERLDELLGGCTEAERSILDRLATGPPIGALRNATLPTAEPSPARSLVERGLLVPIDNHTVELPREIALALRAVPAGPIRPEPDRLDLAEPGVVVIDGGGSTAVLETVRLVEQLLHALATDPAVQLRAGGLGVRDLRRLARMLDVAEPVTALLVELSYEAGLLSSSTTVDPAYLPTTEFDNWLRHGTAERWVQLATAWLAMTRQPSLIGARDDRDKTIAALSADVERHSAPALRLQLLRLLADLPPGSAP
ncbi:MAG: hypothetical protein M3Y42_20200, partial [Actinomycetota bacterium]|nr:hypothetical protein [Actinomycetota bacterium]